MINIGIVGVNELSKKHIEKIIEIPDFNISGFYDRDEESSKNIEKIYGLRRFESYAELVNYSDAVDILTPVGTHFNFAEDAIRNCRHVFVDKVLSEN